MEVEVEVEVGLTTRGQFGQLGFDALLDRAARVAVRQPMSFVRADDKKQGAST